MLNPKRTLICATFLISLLLSAVTPVGASAVAGILEPNLDGITFKHTSADPDSSMASLKAGSIDVIPSLRNLETYLKVRDDPSTQVFVSPGGSTSLACLFFNTRISPFDDNDVRRALSSLVDRSFIASNLLYGTAEPQDTFIPVSLGEWVEPDAKAPLNTLLGALDLMAVAGYSLDEQTNLMVSSSGAPLRELTLLTPQYSEAKGLWIAGNYTAWQMSVIGIPVKHLALNETVLLSRLAVTRDFDMCIYDFDMGPTPFGLYGLLHSSLDKPNTPAFTGIHDPTLDAALDDLYFGLSKTIVLGGAHDAQTRLADLVPYTPIYSISNIDVASPKWEGFVSAPGVGIMNPFSLSSVHESGNPTGGNLVVSLGEAVTSLNPITTGSTSVQGILRLIYSPLLTLDPNTSLETPVLAKSWQTGAWTTDSGKPGMIITFNLWNDTLWHDGFPFTSSDVKFCIDYIRSMNVGSYQGILRNTVRVETPDEATVNIYLNSTGYRHVFSYASMTFLPKHIWENTSDYRAFRPWEVSNPYVKGMTSLVGQGPFQYRRSNLDSVELVGNHMVLAHSSGKPSLIVRSAVPELVKLGDPMTWSYQVKDFDGGTISDPDRGYTFSVMNVEGEVVFEQKAKFVSGKYEAGINTSTLGVGEFTIRFIAPPYGVDVSALKVGQASTQPGQSTGGIPAYPVEATLISLVIVIVVRALKKNKMPSFPE